MHYTQLFSDAAPGEYSIDPQGKAARLIESQATAEQSQDPLDLLCQLEEQLMREFNMTFMQAIRAGILSRDTVSTH